MTERRLGQFEKAQTMSGEYAPFNAVGIVRIMKGPSPKNVHRALDYLQKRHPLLQVRILRKGGAYVFVRANSLPVSFSVHERPDDEYWQRVTEEELNSGFDIATGPLFRCRCLFPPDKESAAEIILTFHHSIVDATSVIRALHELLTQSSNLQMGTPPAEPISMPLLNAEEYYYPDASKGFSGKWRTLRYLARQMGDEIGYRKASRGKRQLGIFPSARCSILPRCLSADQTERLVRACRKKRISMNSVLGAAMLLAVSKLVYDGEKMPLRHFFFADLRPYLNPPVGGEYLGSFHSMMRLTIGFERKQEYWELAERLNGLIYKAAKRGEKFISPLLSPLLMRMFIRKRNRRMGNTALSYPGVTKLQKDYGGVRVLAVHGFVSNFAIGPEYTATARLFDRRLWLDILYLDGDFDGHRAAAIAEAMLSILEAAS
jgi:hypothetical protein